MLRRAAAQASRSLLSAVTEASSTCSRAAAGAGASTSASSSSSESILLFRCSSSSSSSAASAAEWVSRRGFSASASSRRAEPSQVENEEGMPVHASQRVEKVVDEILQLNLLEVAELTDILQKRLGVSPMSFAAPMMGGGGGGGAGGAPAGGAAPAAAAAAPAEEKTEFDVKLDAVDGDARLKVIKEVRAATGLGLKEAKEVVEKAPTVIKAGMKKEEAAELKAKLEAAGAKVSLE